MNGSIASRWHGALCLWAICSAGAASAADISQHTYDLVVYGGTPSGIMAAIEGARGNLRVALVEPGHHLGGMVAGGLSQTDTGNKAVIGGLALEFFQRMGQYYGTTVQWNLEPHVAEQVFNQMLGETAVDVYLDNPLLEPGGVWKWGPHIVSMTTAAGQRFQAGFFVDASYDGVLMDEAGVSYTWGRESASTYQESLAGFLKLGPGGADTNFQEFAWPVSAYASDGSLLPGVLPNPGSALGDGDQKIQAYTYRLCITQQAGNMLPFPKPANYDPNLYALLARQLGAIATAHGKPAVLRDLVTLGALPNGKYDVNNFGAFSVDYLGANWAYPTADAAGRAAIARAQYDYQAGFFYFLGHDPSVPPSLQSEVNSYGLAKDEFADNGGWPWQLYVRESRRMLGTYVMTQGDVQTNVTKPDSIGMGSYAIDSHNVQRIVTADGNAQNEGDMLVNLSKPYQIPYRMLLPRSSEADNLLVTVSISASHAAFSSMRVEPQSMITGQAAGAAASIAAQQHVALGAVPVAALQAQLQAEGAVLSSP